MISKINKQNEKLPDDTKQSLNIISNLSNYIVFLISDIIHYNNNKDPKKIRVNFSTIDFKELTEFCFQILESLLFCNIKKKENIKTSLIFDEKVQYVKTESDEIRIKQILLNLLSNSVKFSNHGEIILKCKLKKIEGKFFVKISVSDTGIGIKSEDMDKLFCEFVQFESGNSENIKLGSGLGLSICKNIAKRLGIKLDVRSEFRKGSKICMLIPVSVSDYDNHNDIKYNNNSNYIIDNNCIENVFIKKRNFIKEKKNNNNDFINNSISDANANSIVIKNYNANDIININKENIESVLTNTNKIGLKSQLSYVNLNNNNSDNYYNCPLLRMGNSNDINLNNINADCKYNKTGNTENVI